MCSWAWTWRTCVDATLKLITQTEGGKLHLEMHDIAIGELPPMATIPEYLTARRR